MLSSKGTNFFICYPFLRQAFIWIPAVAFVGLIENFVAIFELVVVGIALAVL